MEGVRRMKTKEKILFLSMEQAERAMNHIILSHEDFTECKDEYQGLVSLFYVWNMELYGGLE
jgi:hypothetical protein